MSQIRVRRTDDGTKRVQRYDRAEATLDPPSTTAQGYLRAHAAVAVPGVMEYEDEHGKTRRELVPPEELHKTDSLASLASMPVTLSHPDVDVTPENVGELGVGNVGEQVDILAETGHVRVCMVTRRKDALDAIATGTIEVSPGYTCVLDETPGTHPVYGAYDAIQRDRLYNHLAIVDQARGGPTIKLRADSARSVRRIDAAPSPRTGVSPMIPMLLMLAATVGLQAEKRTDGKIFARRADEDPQAAHEVSEEQLLQMIAAAIQKLLAMKAPPPATVAAGAAGTAAPATDGDKTAALEAENKDLKGQIATMKGDEKTRKDAADKAADEAEQKSLDTLASHLDGFSPNWRPETKTAERRIDVLRHAKLVDEKGTVPDAEAVGMIRVLSAQYSDEPTPRADAGPRSSQWDEGRTGEKRADAASPANPNAPAHARKDRAIDPAKAAMAKRRDSERKGAEARRASLR